MAHSIPQPATCVLAKSRPIRNVNTLGQRCQSLRRRNGSNGSLVGQMPRKVLQEDPAFLTLHKQGSGLLHVATRCLELLDQMKLQLSDRKRGQLGLPETLTIPLGLLSTTLALFLQFVRRGKAENQSERRPEGNLGFGAHCEVKMVTGNAITECKNKCWYSHRGGR